MIVIHHQNIVYSMVYIITNFKMKIGVQALISQLGMSYVFNKMLPLKRQVEAYGT